MKLIIHGQGVLFFNATESLDPCTIQFCTADGTVGLSIQWTETGVSAFLEPSHEPLTDPTNNTGLVKQKGAYYWVSLDSQNQRLSAGIGEARAETRCYN